ncbi:MAG: 16S rRNA (cytidine(1402)-2'-O)-methyltransferase, partial [Bdellovibrionota bacterium]
MNPESAIYVVATPIGNLDDLTLRAIKVLKNVDIIAAEDTRRARQLLQHIGRDKAEVISYFDHVEREKAPQLVSRLIEDKLSLALISDAGTPCISDPGYHLVREAKKRGVAVHPVPGPSALTALVSASGLPSDRLLFVGFLPSKKMALEKEISSWKNLSASIVFYEAPRRLKVSLAFIQQIYPNAEIAIGRELTKLHEEIILTDPSGAMDWCTNHDFLKGEAVVMVRLGEPEAQSAESKDHLRATLISDAREKFKNDATLKDLLTLYRDRGLSRS